MTLSGRLHPGLFFRPCREFFPRGSCRSAPSRGTALPENPGTSPCHPGRPPSLPAGRVPCSQWHVLRSAPGTPLRDALRNSAPPRDEPSPQDPQKRREASARKGRPTGLQSPEPPALPTEDREKRKALQ